jgi:hypothetical protein
MELPPGLAGYVQAQQQNQQQGMQQMQMAGLIQQLQARQEAAEKQKAYQTELSGATTDEQREAVALKYGGPEALVKHADRKAAMVDRREAQQAALEQKGEAARARLEQQTQYANMMHEYRMAQAKTAEEKVAADAAHKAQVLQFQQQNAATMAELRRLGLQSQTDRADAAKNANLQRQTQQLGTALERAGLNEVDSVLRGVEDAIKKTPELPEYLSGIKSLAPDLVVSKDIAAGRQAFQKLFNITLKNRSGAAVTNQELERLKQEFATGAWKTPEQLKAGVEQARKIISDHYRGIASGFGTDVLDAYNVNLREMGGTPLLEPRGTPTTPNSGPIKRIKFDAQGNPIGN